jgi:hypothetical protein
MLTYKALSCIATGTLARGVTIPSQIRYVEYYAQHLKGLIDLCNHERRVLHELLVNSIPYEQSGTHPFPYYIEIEQDAELVYTSKVVPTPTSTYLSASVWHSLTSRSNHFAILHYSNVDMHGGVHLSHHLLCSPGHTRKQHSRGAITWPDQPQAQVDARDIGRRSCAVHGQEPFEPPDMRRLLPRRVQYERRV